MLSRKIGRVSFVLSVRDNAVSAHYLLLGLLRRATDIVLKSSNVTIGKQRKDQ